MFDIEHIHQLRRDATLHELDTTRAKITALSDGGYAVTFDKPLVNLGDTLTAPTTIECRGALRAEGEMLSWLLKIQRAERQLVRCGRVFGRTGAWIARTPLTADELADYRADVKHRNAVRKLQEELADVIQSASAKATAVQHAVNLAERYGLSPEKEPVSAPDEVNSTVSVPTTKSRNRKVGA